MLKGKRLDKTKNSARRTRVACSLKLPRTSVNLHRKSERDPSADNHPPEPNRPLILYSTQRITERNPDIPCSARRGGEGNVIKTKEGGRVFGFPT
jgi:hypothetical protein